jgi:hypothetical protein
LAHCLRGLAGTLLLRSLDAVEVALFDMANVTRAVTTGWEARSALWRATPGTTCGGADGNGNVPGSLFF